MPYALLPNRNCRSLEVELVKFDSQDLKNNNKTKKNSPKMWGLKFKCISIYCIGTKKLLIEISRSFTSLTCLTWEVCLKLGMMRWWSLLVLLKRVKCRDVSVGRQLTQMRIINTDRLQGGRIASHFTSICPQNICMNYMFYSQYWLATGSKSPHSQVGWQYTRMTHHFWALS